MNECAALMNGTGSANSCIRCRDWSLNSLHLLLPCGRYYLPASSLHWRHMLWFCFVLPNCDPYKSHTHSHIQHTASQVLWRQQGQHVILSSYLLSAGYARKTTGQCSVSAVGTGPSWPSTSSTFSTRSAVLRRTDHAVYPKHTILRPYYI